MMNVVIEANHKTFYIAAEGEKLSGQKKDKYAFYFLCACHVKGLNVFKLIIVGNHNTECACDFYMYILQHKIKYFAIHRFL